MSRIVLVRHGETIWHAENRYAGSSDIELTHLGRRQAQELANWARSAGFSRLYVSPLQRAQATAQAVVAALALPAIVDARLREIDFGAGEGLTASEMSARFPEQYAAFLTNPVERHLPGGENPIAVIARGRAALEEIAAEAGCQARVLVICHNTLIRLLLCDLLGIAPARYRKVFPSLNSVSLTEILLEEDTASLLQFNASIGGSSLLPAAY